MPTSNRALTVETTLSSSWTRALRAGTRRRVVTPSRRETERMDETKTDGAGGAEGLDRSDKPLGRGLGDGSHLFLSQKDRPAPPPGPRGGMALLRSASVTRDRLAVMLMEFAGALE